jgi:nitrite reductase/ring-hydroxylating ferredoxin subunit
MKGEDSRVATCEVCGNEYDKSFEVTVGGQTHSFDSFECAIHALAPTCEHCGCRIIGHGVEADGRIFCCAHCAQESGVPSLTDRV